MSGPEDVEAGDGFAHTLSRAIERRGLTLAQLSDRLAAAGHPLSTASLSFWRNGQRSPTRRTSQAVVETLESVLELPAGALTNTLAGWARAQRHPMAGLPAQPRLAEALDELGTSLAWQAWPHVVRTQVTIAGERTWTGLRQTLVLRAPRSDTLAVPLILPVPRGSHATLAGQRGANLADPVVLDDLPDAPALLVMRAELPTPLRRGQLAAVEYQLDMAGAAAAWVATAVPARTPLLSLQATFAGSVPGEVWHTCTPQEPDQADDAGHAATVPGGRDVQHTRSEAPVGCHYLRWAPPPLPGR